MKSREARSFHGFRTNESEILHRSWLKFSLVDLHGNKETARHSILWCLLWIGYICRSRKYPDDVDLTRVKRAS